MVNNHGVTVDGYEEIAATLVKDLLTRIKN